jgi:hypothetical protein
MAFKCPFMSGVVPKSNDDNTRYNSKYLHSAGEVVLATWIEGACRAWNDCECNCKLIDRKCH